MSMSSLVEAFHIFLKYGDPQWPTHCAHDELHIMEIKPADVSDEDKARLDELGFIVTEQWGEEHFMSFKYGSA